MLYPHRLVWPAFWGMMPRGHGHAAASGSGERRAPPRPARSPRLDVRRGDVRSEAHCGRKAKALGEDRSRVPGVGTYRSGESQAGRSDQVEGAEEFMKKLADALKALQSAIKEEGGECRLRLRRKTLQARQGRRGGRRPSTRPPSPTPGSSGTTCVPLGNRPARPGCFECHSVGSPIFRRARSRPSVPPPTSQPVTAARYQYAGLNKAKLDAWSQSFLGRTAFKYFGFASMTVVGLVVLSYTLLGINGIVAWAKRK